MLFYCRPFVSLIFLVLLAGILPVASSAHRRKISPANAPNAPATAVPPINEAYGKLPLAFEANQGQTDGRVKFISRGSGYTLFLTSNEAILRLRNVDCGLRNAKTPCGPDVPQLLRMSFVGANENAEVLGEDELAGKTNYFNGSGPQQWRVNIPNFAKVRYHEIYPGVDVVYYGNQRQLEYDFVIRPEADPNIIALDIEGAKKITVNAHGQLSMQTAAGGAVRQEKPYIYQDIAGERRTVAGRYVVRNKNRVGFAVGDYDKSKPLVIDPVLSYATYLGGSNDTYGTSIAVDSSGSAYITGSTTAIDFPTVNPFQATPNHNQPGNLSVGFVTKLNTAGTAFVYSTYLGSANTLPSGIKVDGAGSAFVAGLTTTTNFPTTPGAYLSAWPGGGSGRAGFITKLSPNGASLAYSTYLASPTTFAGPDELNGIALDSSGNAYVTGAVRQPTFPTTAGAYQTTLAAGAQNAFVTKLNAAGSSLIYSTFVGVRVPVSGADPLDKANAVAVDASGNAYITGTTISQNFPVTNGAFQIFPASQRDAFVTKLNANGTALVYSTYLGGNSSEIGLGIAVDASGNAYVTGSTAVFGPNDFPVTPNAFRPFGRNEADAFLTKLNPTGTALVYSTLLGARGGGASGLGVTVDGGGSAYVIGGQGRDVTYSINPVQPSRSNDAFIVKMNPAGTGLAYSTPLGGSNGGGYGAGLALDSSGNAYVTGATTASDFPVTPGAPQAVKPGGQSNTAFVAKIGVNTSDCPAITVGPQPLPAAIIRQSYNQQLSATGGVAPYTFSLAPNFGANNLPPGLTLASDGTLSGTTNNIGAYPITVQAVDANGCVGVRSYQFVVAERPPQLQVSVLGRGAILRGRENRYTFAYTNNSDADAFMVPLYISFPRYFTWRPGFRVLDTIQPLGDAPPIDYSQVPLDYTQGEQKVVPLLLPRIRARSTGTVSIILTAPGEQPLAGFEIGAQLGSPLFNSLPDASGQSSPATFTAHENLAASAQCRSSERFGNASPLVAGSGTACLQALTDLGFSLLSINPALGCGAQFGLYFQGQAASYVQQTAGLGSGENEIAGTLAGTLTGLAATGLQCAFRASPFGQAVAIGQALSAAFSVGTDCVAPLVRFIGNLVGSIDPNDKIGLPGVGVPRYLNGDIPFPYTIYFENLATATAPAQDVVIADQLDVSKFDFNTFSFGDVTIGNLRLAVLPNKREFFKDFDLRPANNIIARINARLDTATGVITWRFQSIDPVTGLPTDDPLAGILPPNTVSPRGEGSVMFTVKAKSNLVTGAEIRNQARIVFDTNAPIDTPVWLNTLDNSIPASSVAPLAAQQTTHSFTVNWLGTDTGSGISGYTVFVSENGGPFNAWLTNTPATSAIFYGGDNKTYAFYTIARDAAGNLEAAPAVADTVTTTPAGNPIQEARWFVRQHYVDFLAREPDDGGLQYWTEQITNCGTNAACVSSRRIGVSAAFFVELEYQESAAYVYRLYKAAYGEQTLYRPPYALFLPDRQRVVGGATLNQGKLDFANLFVARNDFLTRYPASMSAAQFVDALLATVQQGANVVFTGAERAAFIADVNSAGGRGLMLKNLGDNAAFRAAVYNRAFVLTQYFGYLRRDPDQGGYDFWLGVLNQQPNNFRGMVCAFITSAEYQLRFSPATPRSNAECAGNP